MSDLWYFLVRTRGGNMILVGLIILLIILIAVALPSAKSAEGLIGGINLQPAQPGVVDPKAELRRQTIAARYFPTATPARAR